MRRKKYWGIIVAVGLAAGLGAASPDGDPTELTISQCIEISLAHNPLWLSSEHDLRASRARVEQAKAIPQPNLDFDSDLQPDFLNFRDSGESYLGVSQTVEFPGRRALRTRIARLESDEASAERSILRAEIVFQIKEAFYGVLLAEEKKTYAARNLALARDFLEKAKVKYEAGDVARMEFVRAGVEESKAATNLAVAENKILMEKARLNFLLGRPKSEALKLRGSLVRGRVPFETEVLGRRAEVARPEMIAMNARLVRAAAEKKKAALSYLPDFNLGLSRHRLTGEKTSWDFTLSIPVPLFFWQPLRGEVAEKQANLMSLEQRVRQMRNSIRLEVEQAGFQARAAENQIVLFQDKILTQAREAYDLFFYSFQEGEITGIELIEARRTLIEALESYADALFVYNMALASLEKAVGEPFEGEKIE